MEEDNDKAFEWFEKSAAQGHGRALFLLGECFEEGNGVQADLEKAKQYYQKAADKGYKSAKEALQRLEGSVQEAEEKPAPPPQTPEVKGKPKRGGLFGFFKK